VSADNWGKNSLVYLRLLFSPQSIERTHRLKNFQFFSVLITPSHKSDEETAANYFYKQSWQQQNHFVENTAETNGKAKPCKTQSQYNHVSSAKSQQYTKIGRAHV